MIHLWNLYIINPIQFKKELIRRSSGSTFLEISKKRNRENQYKVPSIEEQNKIASFLSVVDKKIELTGEKYREFKKIPTSKHVLLVDKHRIKSIM